MQGPHDPGDKPGRDWRKAAEALSSFAADVVARLLVEIITRWWWYH